MDDTQMLDPGTRAELLRLYGGTRLGRQELGGERREDFGAALWQAPWIEGHRVKPDAVPPLLRVVVAVDPAATAEATSDFTGIAVAGVDAAGEYYVLASAGYQLSPAGWAKKVVDAYESYNADMIIGEANNGGDMVLSTIRTAWSKAPVKKITASRGKQVRAEPVALLYEQGRVHHVGAFPTLEDQMLTFPVENEHDDELD